MTRLKWIILVVSCIGFYSCEKKSEQIIKEIDIKEPAGRMMLSDLCDSIWCIPLETKSQSLFKKPDKLIVYDQRFYILDKSGAEKILVFNEDGSYCHSIGTKGNGQGEYITIEDFTLDEEKEQVVILSYPSKVYIYDLNGNFIHAKELGKSLIWNICSYKDGYVCSTNHQTYTEGEEAYLLFFYDKNFSLQNKMLPVLPVHITMPPFVSCPLYTTDNEIVYFDNFTSQLHLISLNQNAEFDSNLLYSCHFTCEPEVSEEVYKDVMSFFDRQNEFSFFIESYYANDTVYAFIAKQGKLAFLMADIHTGQGRFSWYNKYYPEILTSKDGYFYSFVSPTQLMEDKNVLFHIINDEYEPQIGDNFLVTRFKIRH